MNLGAARTLLLSLGFDFLGSSTANTLLNNAKNALEDEFAWPWLEATTAGAAPLTISDLKQVLYVVNTTDRTQLTGLDARDITDRDAIVTTTGTPDSWYLDGETTLRTYPASTSTQLSVRYIKFSPELSGDSDTPLIPVRYHMVWVDYAKVEAYKESHRYNEATALLAHLRQYRLPQMIETYATRNRMNPGYASVTWASDDW